VLRAVQKRDVRKEVISSRRGSYLQERLSSLCRKKKPCNLYKEVKKKREGGAGDPL